jgi:hypothetical protein
MFTLAFYQLVAPLRSLYSCALSGAACDLAFRATRSALIGPSLSKEPERPPHSLLGRAAVSQVNRSGSI